MGYKTGPVRLCPRAGGFEFSYPASLVNTLTAQPIRSCCEMWWWEGRYCAVLSFISVIRMYIISVESAFGHRGSMKHAFSVRLLGSLTSA